MYAEVLNEFATKKCVKLGKLLKEGGGLELKNKKKKHRKKTDQDIGRVNPNSDLDSKENGADDAVSSHHLLDFFNHYKFTMTGSVILL